MANGKEGAATDPLKKPVGVAREFKSFRFELESAGDDGEFSGYAAVFGNVDSGGDVIEKGAFAQTIVDDFDRIKILSQHNSCDLPIGKPLELREDEKGLFIRGKISDTQAGRDIKTLLKDGVLAELSIGYDAIDFDFDSVGVRHLKQIRLWEVSIVTWAMNDQAKIGGFKSLMEGLSAEVKSGRNTRSRLDALRLFIAVVKEMSELLTSFLDPAEQGEPQELTDPTEPAGGPAAGKNDDHQKQKKTAETVFEIVRK